MGDAKHCSPEMFDFLAQRGGDREMPVAIGGGRCCGLGHLGGQRGLLALQPALPRLHTQPQLLQVLCAARRGILSRCLSLSGHKLRSGGKSNHMEQQPEGVRQT